MLKDFDQVAIILGSETDQKVLVEAEVDEIFRSCKVKYDRSVLSAHRHEKELSEYCKRKLEEGTLVFIGVVGLMPALPGTIMAAINRRRPVLGVLLSTPELPAYVAVQTAVAMPKGSPVSVGFLNKDGMANACLFACSIIGTGDPAVYEAYCRYCDFLASKKPPKIGIGLPIKGVIT